MRDQIYINYEFPEAREKRSFKAQTCFIFRPGFTFLAWNWTISSYTSYMDNEHVMRTFFSKKIPNNWLIRSDGPNKLWGVRGSSSWSISTHFVIVCLYSLVNDFSLINNYFYKKNKILRHFKGKSIWALQRVRDSAIMGP